MQKRTKITNKYLKHPIDSVFEDGYGQVPKKVMQDPRLSIEAKGIYAYLCSFAGGGNTAFPSIKKMCTDLNIARDRYYRHIADIVLAGYLIVNKYQDKSRKFIGNEYVFNYEVPKHSKDHVEVYKNGGWTACEMVSLKKGDRYRMFDKKGKPVVDKTTGECEFVLGEDFTNSVKNAYKGTKSII